MTNESTEMIT